ncbi:hypothetical protein ACTI_40900 [Actinoplanes sp. OR16]|uniref:substrate-binding and VWA domain-containing protein n=1 Tax=Actinoplanes sp. OR16 TaxID=946334 RepID=UPI000F6B47D2|nr:substrate-binding and VWA domain-containing protein [Actinoplanes sp. OR16]BBH67405.1 hypothetical protein ACTI_40900 [Actinoplanes sp. OR16]
MSDGSLRARPEFWPVSLLSIALIAVLAGWSGGTYLDRTRNESGCAERTTLRIAAAPSVVPPVREIAAQVAGRQPCLDILVEGRESADVLRALARTAPETVAASSSVSSPSPAKSNEPSESAAAATASEAPDVWLPESTLWLRRARATGAFTVPAEGVSVAGTPIVLSLAEKSADRLSTKKTPLNWQKLVGATTRPMPVVLPDPATSPVGFGALVGIRRLAGSKAAGTAAIMRRLSPDTASVAGETVPDPTGPGKDEEAVVSTEHQVLQAALDGRRQVAVYPPAAVPGLDYPFAVLTTDTRARSMSTTLLRALLAKDGVAAVTEHGLRTPDGSAPDGVPAATKVRTTTYEPAALPSESDAEDLLNAWGGVHISARMLAVFDVSGSMESAVPGSSDTRMSATIKAAQDGAKLLLATTELGVWEFSTDLVGKRDYREVVPVGPLGPRRDEILSELGRMKAKPNGQTGLYDTTLAAYRDATRNWTPGRINMVLILTDGTDDNASGIGRAKLLSQLSDMFDRKRPVPILFIGVGPEIDSAELNAIAEVTNGKVALTDKPSGIRQIFYTALAEFSCLPPECRR